MALISLIVLAKYPEPGAVKTRMVPPLSSVEAADLHRASLLTVLETVCGIAGIRVSLAVAPDDSVDAMAALVSDFNVECQPQGSGDLGRRLDRLTDAAMREGANGVILLGADSPTLPAEILVGAKDQIARGDAVLGPCLDGGYYLLGLPKHLPALFQGIAWGSATVAEQTRVRAAEAGMHLSELPSWYDLDHYDDLARGARDLARFLFSNTGPNAMRSPSSGEKPRRLKPAARTTDKGSAPAEAADTEGPRAAVLLKMIKNLSGR